MVCWGLGCRGRIEPAAGFTSALRARFDVRPHLGHQPAKQDEEGAADGRLMTRCSIETPCLALRVHATCASWTQRLSVAWRSRHGRRRCSRDAMLAPIHARWGTVYWIWAWVHVFAARQSQGIVSSKIIIINTQFLVERHQATVPRLSHAASNDLPSYLPTYLRG